MPISYMFHLRGVGNNNDHHNLIRVNFVEVMKCGSDVCVMTFCFYKWRIGPWSGILWWGLLVLWVLGKELIRAGVPKSIRERWFVLVGPQEMCGSYILNYTLENHVAIFSCVKLHICKYHTRLSPQIAYSCLFFDFPNCGCTDILTLWIESSNPRWNHFKKFSKELIRAGVPKSIRERWLVLVGPGQLNKCVGHIYWTTHTKTMLPYFHV